MDPRLGSDRDGVLGKRCGVQRKKTYRLFIASQEHGAAADVVDESRWVAGTLVVHPEWPGIENVGWKLEMLRRHADARCACYGQDGRDRDEEDV